MPEGDEFVQIGDRIFNRRHIVALSNLGKSRTTVHTADMDFAVEIPLGEAAELLALEYVAVDQ